VLLTDTYTYCLSRYLIYLVCAIGHERPRIKNDVVILKSHRHSYETGLRPSFRTLTYCRGAPCTVDMSDRPCLYKHEETPERPRKILTKI